VARKFLDGTDLGDDATRCVGRGRGGGGVGAGGVCLLQQRCNVRSARLSGVAISTLAAKHPGSPSRARTWWRRHQGRCRPGTSWPPSAARPRARAGTSR
jgi:hypothetical protein